jgi:uncharacterized protein (DUF1778 family)
MNDNEHTTKSGKAKPARQRLGRFNLRLTADERAALDKIAASEHLTPSAWLRRAAIMAARKAGA